MSSVLAFDGVPLAVAEVAGADSDGDDAGTVVDAELDVAVDHLQQHEVLLVVGVHRKEHPRRPPGLDVQLDRHLLAHVVRVVCNAGVETPSEGC